MEKNVSGSRKFISDNPSEDMNTGSMHTVAHRRHCGVPTMNVAIVLLCLTWLSFHLIFGLYARYTSTASGSDSGIVAVFNVGETNTIQKTYSINAAASSAQTITVEMKDESEVSVLYTFSFETSGNLPLKIEAAPPAGVTLTQASGKNEWSVEKSAGKFEENYVFTISIDGDSYIYSGCVSDIQLTVTADQTD